MNKIIIIIIIILSILFSGYFLFTGNILFKKMGNESTQMKYEEINENERMDNELGEEAQDKMTQGLAPIAKGMRKISKEEFIKHNNKNDCWVIYKGGIYDVTTWLQKHPGGIDKIAQSCGKDGFEEKFTRKHGISKERKFYTVTQFLGSFEEPVNKKIIIPEHINSIHKDEDKIHNHSHD